MFRTLTLQTSASSTRFTNQLSRICSHSLTSVIELDTPVTSSNLCFGLKFSSNDSICPLGLNSITLLLGTFRTRTPALTKMLPGAEAEPTVPRVVRS